MSLFSKIKKQQEKTEEEKIPVLQPEELKLEDEFDYSELDLPLEEPTDSSRNTFSSKFEDYYDSYDGAYFYKKYLEKIKKLREEWQEEIKQLKTSELFEILKKRYEDSTPRELYLYGDSIKNEICSFAEEELKKRANANQSKKTYYHVFGELVCKSFNHNNVFPQERYRNNPDLVTWIRERYAYLYANLSEDDFKTECQSGLDMIDLDKKLDAKLKANYSSLVKKSEKHTTTKSIELEKKMLMYLNEILGVNQSYSYDPFSIYSKCDSSPEEQENKINQTYREQYKFVKDEW